jgi:hypothetical protein
VLVTTGIEVTGVVVEIGAIVFCVVIETVVGIDVGTIVVGGCVCTGAGVDGDAHPAAKTAASKNTIVIISVLVPFI